MDAYIASVPIHLLYAMQMIKQKDIRECDLYYVPTSNNAEELLNAVRKTSFKTARLCMGNGIIL